MDGSKIDEPARRRELAECVRRHRAEIAEACKTAMRDSREAGEISDSELLDSIPEPESRATESRDILIVEDNVDAAEMLRALLELSGHHVGVAETGGHALNALHETKPDVVLCDLGLPDMSGYELARAIRENDALRGIKLVAVTGYGQPEDRRRTEDAGFDAHLTKPIDLHALETILAG